MRVLGTHAVKVKAPDMKRWAFVMPNGALVHQRIHAGTASPEVCQAYVESQAVKHPDTQFKVVKL